MLKLSSNEKRSVIKKAKKFAKITLNNSPSNKTKKFDSAVNQGSPVIAVSFEKLRGSTSFGHNKHDRDTMLIQQR